MKTLMFVMFGTVCLFAGCRVVEIKNKGESVVTDADGRPVMRTDGTVQTIKNGWSVYHNQHWMLTKADSITAAVRPAEIDFSLNGLHTEPSEQLGVVIDKSLSGVALLAEKVGAAIATSGGSVATDAAKAAITRAIGNFVGKGGDPSKASVTCADGSCTISDGAVSEVCTECIDR